MRIILALALAFLLGGCSQDGSDGMTFKEPVIISKPGKTPERKQKPKGLGAHKRLEELQQEALGLKEEDSILDVINKATEGMK